MENYTVFHKTARGASHIRRDTPCEDASISFSQEDGLYHIAVVADGHGDPSCFRSSIGSKTAVSVAEECLKTFAEAVLETRDTEKSIEEELALPKKCAQYMKQLTDTIISRWAIAVHNDLSENPFTHEDLKASGDKAEDYAAGKHLEHIYGTTLMAALLVGDKLILLHQGDGRCDVFYEDGTVDQPIPWDDRCQGNVTTSMCDADAAASVRTCVLDLRERPVIACFLGSDGVEDSYRNMEGTHTFYRKLSCELVSQELPEFEAYLKNMLPEFSATGSQDDVSVAGIVDIEGLKIHADAFQAAVEEYDRNENIFILQYKQAEYEKRLTEDMPRKLEILCRQKDQARQSLADCRDRKQKCEHSLEALQKTQGTKNAELIEAKEKVGGLLQNIEEITNGLLEAIGTVIKVNLKKEENAIAKLEQRIDEEQILLNQLTKECAQLETVYNNAERDYDEYDEKRQQVQESLNNIINALAELGCELESAVELPVDEANEEEDNG